MALSLGDMPKAKAAFEEVLTLAPREVNALAALNRIAPFDRGSARVKRLRQIARDRKAERGARATAYNALGRIEEAAGQTRATFHNFARAKALSPGRYDRDAVEALVSGLSQVPGDGFAPCGTAEDAPRVVFVCGMPRSGTTLVESILLRHPETGSIGESSALGDVLAEHRATLGGAGAWDWVARTDDAQAARLGARYLERCAACFPDGLPGVILDKTPLNLFQLGFASRILPGARFVMLSRHPLDVGLSNFVTNFHAAHPFSRTLESIGHMTRCAARAAVLYEARLGAAFRRQSYAALVTEPEAQVRAMLGHLGLGWEVNCLHPEARDGAIGTASLTQARAPISAGAMGKWRRYEAELQPLIEALGAGWIDDWAAEDARQPDT
ncbi:sulfotransferase [Roseovarius faecimaris]|uniref:Sulfotransferase n=1 Tax=Roseovarius faecimaris TaxID=2494550 RepID=A0A6I6IKA7_9RHOB|nr:sulfotransferase [Roseovarius faecimaris]QGX97045.1 sulfotransferase [Roseovarius faecimaris]